MPNIKIKQQKPIDERWYDRLLRATQNISETFVMLEPVQEQLAIERGKFESSGYISTPNLLPVHLDVEHIEDAIHKLADLLSAIRGTEPNPYVQEAYEGHIQERITNLEMIYAARTGDQKTFIAKNIVAYDMPDDDIFAAAIAWIRENLLSTPLVDNLELARLRDEALKYLPDISGDSSMLIPKNAVFREVRRRHFIPDGYFEQLFAPHGMPKKSYVEQEFGDDITRQAISNVGSDYSIKTADDGLWAVLPLSRQVVRPLGYRVDRDYFIGVIAHEIGSHLLEESNGFKQSLQLLRLGLGGYEKGNEGRAFLREQIVYPDERVFVRQSSWEYILMLHFSVSLASGLYRKQYPFADLYACLYALHRFYRQRRYPLATNNEAEARGEAWLLTVRVMKGTNCAGGCYMKDTVYLEGNLNCWLIAEQEPEIILHGDIGKFNIADPAHIKLLRNLHVLPKLS